MQLSDYMLKELRSENAMTRGLLGKLTNECLTWKPEGDLHTIGWNASHLVETVGWLPGILAESEFDIAPPGQPAHTTPEVHEVGQLLEQFDRCAAAAEASLQGVADSTMHETWSLKMGGQTLFTMPKGECIQKWVFSHGAHHEAFSRSICGWRAFSFGRSTKSNSHAIQRSIWTQRDLTQRTRSRANKHARGLRPVDAHSAVFVLRSLRMRTL